MVRVTAPDGAATPEPYDWVYSAVPGPAPNLFVFVRWMVCHNDKCAEIIVEINRKLTERMLSPQTILGRSMRDLISDGPIKSSESWIALPRHSIPKTDPLISGEYLRNYREAWAILDDSPRMSAVLSRRILADLLKEYAALGSFKLSTRVDKFIENEKHPRVIRENLHYLREMADFSAHTQTDGNDNVIDVTKDEAEWTLKIIGELFDYFIVSPETNAKVRAAFDEKLKLAGRKPIKPLIDEKLES